MMHILDKIDDTQALREGKAANTDDEESVKCMRRKLPAQDAKTDKMLSHVVEYEDECVSAKMAAIKSKGKHTMITDAGPRWKGGHGVKKKNLRRVADMSNERDWHKADNKTPLELARNNEADNKLPTCPTNKLTKSKLKKLYGKLSDELLHGLYVAHKERGAAEAIEQEQAVEDILDIKYGDEKQTVNGGNAPDGFEKGINHGINAFAEVKCRPT